MKYNVTNSNKQKYVWFRTAKCGTRSILQFLTDNTDIDVNGYNVKYDNRWKDYFKFAIVRNPWDRLVSCWTQKFNFENLKPKYYEKLKLDGTRFVHFKEFIMLLSDDSKLNSDIHWMPLNKLFPVDFLNFIGKFENLQEDFNTICDKIGIAQQKLPHKNKTKHKCYTEYYDDETRQIVAEKYANDIKNFGYKFGE